MEDGSEPAASRLEQQPIRARSSGWQASSETPPKMTDFSTLSDAVLVVAIGRWAEAALTEVYRRHGGAVHALAQRLLGPGGRADDVTQDVFVELWNRP